MLHALVLLLTLFNCIDGALNLPNMLIPLTRTGAQPSVVSNSSLLQKIIDDPEAFISEMASVDPDALRNVIELLKDLIGKGTTQVENFHRDVTEALADKTKKTVIHDDLNEELTVLNEELTTLKASIAAKTSDVATAQTDKEDAVAHHTAMVAEQDANVGTLESENAAIRQAIILLEGIVPDSDKVYTGDGFRLFKMPAVSGIADDMAGVTKYQEICKAAGYSAVGCGLEPWRCDTDKYRLNNEPCIEMPSAWNCNMLLRLRDATGWTDTNLLALKTVSPYSGPLYAARTDNTVPVTHIVDPAVTYNPVCGIHI